MARARKPAIHTAKKERSQTMFATLAIICCTASLGGAIAIHAGRLLAEERAPIFPGSKREALAATSGAFS